MFYWLFCLRYFSAKIRSIERFQSVCEFSCNSQSQKVILSSLSPSLANELMAHETKDNVEQKGFSLIQSYKYETNKKATCLRHFTIISASPRHYQILNVAIKCCRYFFPGLFSKQNNELLYKNERLAFLHCS